MTIPANKQRSGYILVQALVVIGALVALMAVMAADQHATIQGIQNRLRERRAEAAAQAAVARGVAVLQQANTNAVTLNDDWAKQGTNGDDQFTLGDDATFRMQIIDAASLMNINTASQQQLTALPLDQDQIDCLLDWRSASTQPRGDGAKDSYYNGLPQPYNTKLGPLTTVDELLLVKNWTAQTLYQPPTQTTTLPLTADTLGNTLPLAGIFTVDSGSPNTSATGSALLNLSGARPSVTSLINIGIPRPLATTISARAPFTTFASMATVPGMTIAAMRSLVTSTTVYTGTRLTGRLNANTASQAVLQTVPNIGQSVAESIVGLQSSGFQTLGTLANITASPLQLGQLADVLSVGSDTWLVRAYGESGGVGVPVEAVVRISTGTAKILNWERFNTTGVPEWWNWNTQTNSNLDAGAEE